MAQKMVLAFEGIDGAGKSSLAAFTQRLCERFGQPWTSVGRAEGSAGPLVARLTHLLHEETAALTPRSDLFLRVARDYQRASLAARVPRGVVILDRFILSTLALARIRRLDVQPVLSILEDVAARGHLFATVFVKCPWREALRRVHLRRQQAGRDGNARQNFERRVSQFLEQDFRNGVLTRKQWLIDNSRSLEAAEQQVADYLVPYLQGDQ
jgi:thymidylate kinase